MVPQVFCQQVTQVLCRPWIQQLMRRRGKGVKPLPVQPGRSTSHLRRPRRSGLLSITAATNEEAVRMDHRNCHPNPHIIHHLRILTIPLAGQVGGQPLLHIPSERILFLINCELRNVYSTSLKTMHTCALFSYSLGNEEE